MSNTRVTQQMLFDAARKAETVGGGIAAQLSNLMGTIESQGAASFRGGAGNSMQNTSQQLSASLQRLLQALNSMAELTSKSAVDFGSSDEEVASEIRAVAGNYSESPVVSALRG